MNCETAIDLIIDSLMDTVDPEQRDRLDAHLRSCESCANEARAMGWAWEGLGRLASPEETPAQVPRLLGPATTVRWAAARPWLRVAAAVALLLVGGAGGFWYRGAASSSPGPPARTAFLLLVRGHQPEVRVPESTLVREYAAWASTLADQGLLLGAEKLTDDGGRRVSAAAVETPAESDISGYFLISASDYAQAVEIARTSPHVRYGGTFEIRRIDAGPPVGSGGGTGL